MNEPDAHPGKLICDRCGKVIEAHGFHPSTCHDCGGAFVHPTAEMLACDRCGSEDAQRVFGPTEHDRLCDDCVDYVNAKAALPEYISDPPLKVDGGIWLLTVSGQCRCGEFDWGLAPDWKVPAEQGGGYMTSQCSGCLGTMEYDEQWERLHNLVSEYSELRPEDE